ncbi:MAG: serine protease [Planctomycetia bacterium]|nr:serine protease [Planctomycetia bacterium]
MINRLIFRAGLGPVTVVFLGYMALLANAAAPPPAAEVSQRYAVFRKPVPSGPADLLVIQKTVKDVLKRAIPATVGLRIGASAGSGVIVSEDGYVLTAGHVSGKPGEECDVILSDGKTVKGKTLGRNTAIDSGMIKITTTGKYPFVDMGISKPVGPNQWCIAVGHPRGYMPGRAPVVRVGRVIFANSEVIRTDNALVGGDSGGPLFDLEGNVIGIHSRINMTMESNFHVPVDTYRNTWTRLAKGDSWGSGPFGFSLPTPNPKGPNRPAPAKAFMGIGFEPDTTDLKLTQVTEGMPADKAGLKVGDVLKAVDGKELKVRDDLMTFMQTKKPGDTIELTIEREGQMKKFKVKLVERPSE